MHSGQTSDEGPSPSSSKWTIERLDSAIEYDEFLNRFLIPNVPCVLPEGLILDWPAYKEWRSKESTAQVGEGLHPAFETLSARYGTHLVPVVERTWEKDEDKCVIRRRENVPLNEAIDELRMRKKDKTGRLYIKDWHLVRQEKLLLQLEREEGIPYTTPAIFADDWMNNAQDESEDDFRFCYAGVAGTQTFLHCDVYTSYSWSTNLVGVKRWRLFPPSAKRHLRKFPLVETSEMAESVEEMQRLSFQGRLGPISKGGAGWEEWSLAMEQCHEILQAEGETIFVPSNWHHEVSNLTDCISLNHNWCNSTNIASMYRAMCEEVMQVECALEDVCEMMRESEGEGWQREWTSTVQRIVESNAGWAWKGFWTMVQRNLLFPSCDASLRPQQSFVKEKLLPCAEDFLSRHDYPFLTEETRATAKECLCILQHQQ